MDAIRTYNRAPKGGIEFGGKFYWGGCFVPAGALVQPICGGAPEIETVEVDLSHTYDTWGNYGQHDGSTDPARIGGQFVRCDELPGAVVEDSSAHSRKNRHEKIAVRVALPVGTLGRTDHDYASSGRSSFRRTYWRVGADGAAVELGHRKETVNAGRVAETWHVLDDGERILASRRALAPRNNAYPGRCCDCGSHSPAGTGELLKIGGQWATRCVDCFAKG